MIAIKDVKLGDIEIKVDSKGVEVTGAYSLMSIADVVLAKQNFNGYGNIKIQLSIETTAAVMKVRELLANDVKTVLGMTEDK